MPLSSLAHAAKCEMKDWTKSRFASFKDGVPQKSAAYALTRMGSRLCCRISRQSWSRKRGWPLVDCFVEEVPSDSGGRLLESEPSSSTEQRPMPYAFRRARFTARVSAMRNSAPWTMRETLEGSASPYPTKPLELGDL